MGCFQARCEAEFLGCDIDHEILVVDPDSDRQHSERYEGCQQYDCPQLLSNANSHLGIESLGSKVDGSALIDQSTWARS